MHTCARARSHTPCASGSGGNQNHICGLCQALTLPTLPSAHRAGAVRYPQYLSGDAFWNRLERAPRAQPLISQPRKQKQTESRTMTISLISRESWGLRQCAGFLPGRCPSC